MENYHRLLRRQIKNHFGNINAIPKIFENFINTIDLAYKDYDKDLNHVERILKESSDELIKLNKELKKLNIQNEKVIDEKTTDLLRTTYNLEYAEKISKLGHFNLLGIEKKLLLSKELTSMIGSNKNEYDLFSFSEIFEHSEEFYSFIENSFQKKSNQKIENIRIKNDTRYFTLLLENIGDENELSFIGVLQDNTIIKENEITMENSLKEKEALLGEIHHRVKNNIALISGIIELQAIEIENENIRKHFLEIQNRISAISYIHEKLYQSNNFAKIDLKEYIEELVNSIIKFFSKNEDIKVNYDLDSIYVTTKHALPIALIVNELVTNSLKYAFNDPKIIGKMDIILKKNNDSDTISFTISDNGPGIPINIDISKSKSLGFKLLNIFTKQLKGTYQIKNEIGLSITICFKNE
jgi:two-component sensor histidine kinase